MRLRLARLLVDEVNNLPRPVTQRDTISGSRLGALNHHATSRLEANPSVRAVRMFAMESMTLECVRPKGVALSPHPK